ncbi:MAG TPA: hypothetical protein VKX46_13130 [Ktedonobacteraceae bacterium]|nr:hypothetical protein [Ktedonobacteraceae bacterium]
MQHSVPIPTGNGEQSARTKRWPWHRKTGHTQTALSSSSEIPQDQVTSDRFYERAIEWTHRADKVINLVLGYLLAVASVLGFMDVLSNGEVLSNVPYLFYVWLAIMGLGVDFQILLVVGRIPDLAQMVSSRWAKIVFFVFNIAFLLFLCYMSIIIGAVFTQHRDVPTMLVTNPQTHASIVQSSTIASAMAALGINTIHFVYERAALATLLLVLMAVDRTMERWRMHMNRRAVEAAAEKAQAEAQAAAQRQHSEPEKAVEAAPALSTQDMQTLLSALAEVKEMRRELALLRTQSQVHVTEEYAQKTLPPAWATHEGQQAIESPAEAEADLAHLSFPETGPLPTTGKLFRQDQHKASVVAGYGERIEALLTTQPTLAPHEVARQIGCSTRTATRWMKRIRPDNDDPLDEDE